MKLTESTVNNPRNFIFGGKAEFTISNTKSGNSYKYKVNRSKKNASMYFIRFAKGNESYKYAGFLYNDGKSINFVKGKKGICEKTDPAIRGLFYAIKYGDKALPNPMEMHHHGRCCCCGRALTDKESVERGMGPICAGVK